MSVNKYSISLLEKMLYNLAFGTLAAPLTFEGGGGVQILNINFSGRSCTLRAVSRHSQRLAGNLSKISGDLEDHAWNLKLTWNTCISYEVCWHPLPARMDILKNFNSQLCVIPILKKSCSLGSLSFTHRK